MSSLKKTMELDVKRKLTSGRPPKGVSAMSNAERQRAYRERVKQQAGDATVASLSEVSTAALMIYLKDALGHLAQEDDYVHRARAERALCQLAARYRLDVS